MHTLRCLLLAWVIIPFFSTAQSYEYQPMVIDGAHWFMFWDTDCSTPWIDYFYVYSIKGDTIVDGLNFKKIYLSDLVTDSNTYSPIKPYQISQSSLAAILREDIINRKVWGRFYNEILALDYGYGCSMQGQLTSDEEVLLFDFSIEHKDTINWCYLPEKNLGLDSPIIDSITIVNDEQIGANNLRAYNTSGYYTEPCTIDLIPTEYKIFEKIGFELKGLFLDRGLLGNYCLGSRTECGILTATKEVIDNNDIIVFPNPTSDRVHIQIPVQKKDTYINIYTIYGELINTVPYKENVSVEELPTGVYLLEVKTTDRVIDTKKLIIQR